MSVTLRLALITVFCVVMYNVYMQVLIPLYESTVNSAADRASKAADYGP